MRSLVLLPGTLCDARVFGPQIEVLADDIAIVVGDVARDVTIEAMARRVLASAPDRFDLAGLSLGGIVALEVIRQAPHRVTRLALLDTNHRRPTSEQIEQWGRFDGMTRCGAFDGIPQLLLPRLTIRPEDDATRTLIVDMARSVGSEGFLLQNAALPLRPDAASVLGQIQVPTLVLCGAADEVCPVAVHEEMAAAIPDAELVVVPAAGHLATLDNPDAVSAALRQWLARPIGATTRKAS